jgi:hypothetical protein
MNRNHLIILPRELARFRSRFTIGESSIVGRAILDDSFYLWRYPDVAEVEPFRHFLIRGQVELRKPNCLFEVDYYIERHREECCVDSLDLDQTPVGHFLGCEFFTCPTPLLTLKSGEDRSANRRALYLSLVTKRKMQMPMQPHILMSKDMELSTPRVFHFPQPIQLSQE